MTVYKNKKTRSSINSLLDTYDKIYQGDDYPPSQDVLDELDKVKDDVKSQVVNDGIMTEEEFDEIYEEEKLDSYLTKVFDSNDLGYKKFKVKVFEIDYSKFNDINK